MVQAAVRVQRRVPAKSVPWWRPTPKKGVHLLCALPLAWLAWNVLNLVTGWVPVSEALSINPIETIIRYLGDWALRFIVIALAVTPARRLLRRPQIARYRRMLGLWAFAYALLHMSSYVVLDQFFDWSAIGHDIAHNKFIMMGMAAFTMLVPLAITSTNTMARRLGAARWQWLHRLVYLVGICASIHYIWMVKLDIRQPIVYAFLVLVLLGLRVYWAVTAAARRRSATAMATS